MLVGLHQAFHDLRFQLPGDGSHMSGKIVLIALEHEVHGDGRPDMRW
jgi:hypothetical protein